MSFPDKAKRKQCWDSRDNYWKCLDSKAPQHSTTSGQEEPSVCISLRKLFESNCPAKWVEHFDRKRSYELFKEKMQAGFDPVEQNQKTK